MGVISFVKSFPPLCCCFASEDPVTAAAGVGFNQSLDAISRTSVIKRQKNVGLDPGGKKKSRGKADAALATQASI